MEKHKKRSLFIFLLTIFCILSIILGIIKLIQSIPQKELISTKTYDIYELTIKNDRVYFSFIDDNQKINKYYYYEGTIFKKLYIGEKNQVTLENWGRSGKVSEIKFTKFHLDENTYKNFSQEFDWEYDYNI